MVTVTYKQIIESKEALVFLSEQRFDIKTSYWLGKLLKSLDDHLKVLFNERERLTKENEDKDQLTTLFNEFIEQTVEVNIKNKIDLSNKTVEITPIQAMLLEPFCVFETVELK